jgi:HTH-type transcriptional repressor of NAD biosynthesis genes
MKRGLVIGKFMPIHNGHIALINFAVQQCDEVIVSMSHTPHDSIDAELRFQWIKEIFKNNPRIKPAIVKDDFDNETLPLEERTKIWAAFLKKTFPSVDFIFSSEEYGEPLARHLNATHKIFDLSRIQIPVSATLIRKKPFHYWNFIPEIVRPFFVKKICFYGPESTGKSTMAKRMAEIFDSEFVPEVARELITKNDFTAEDIIIIGKAQTQRVLEKTKTANKFVFCDTDLITTQIYSQYYLNTVPEILYELENEVRYDHYFLFDIDVPWISDGLRDLGDNRKEMYAIFKTELDKRKVPYTKVQGTYEGREKLIIQEINKFL